VLSLFVAARCRARIGIWWNGNAGSLVPISFAHKLSLSSGLARVGCCAGAAALLVALGCSGLQNATAEGDTRTISFHHMHTGEDLTITFKVNGRYDEEALKKIDYELRDWRRDETIRMDPHLIDLLWEVHRDVGATEPIWVVCGYRSPETNAMLRQRSSGVAKFSQHMLGKATDFYIPGVPLEQLQAVGLYLQRGGVGFYPTSGSPFVHLDTGSVRHWPAIAADHMPKLMAEGQHLHSAAEASEVASSRRQPAVLAKLEVGRGGIAQGATQPPSPTAAQAAAPRREAARPAPIINVAVQVEKPGAIPMPQGKSKPQPASFELASAESRPVQLRPSQAASLVASATPPSANDIINQSDYWRGAQNADANDIPRPPAPIPPRGAAILASAEADATASLAPWPLPDRGDPRLSGRALAYADPTTLVAPVARPAPMGVAATRPAAPPDTTVAVKRSGDRPTVISSSPGAPAQSSSPDASKSGDRFNEPWLRAMIVSPNVQDVMMASALGAPDYRGLTPQLRKPSSSVMMTLSQDPQLDLPTRMLSGPAVVFVSTVTFSNARTASLR
jgi:uncharacterized protein YcbK (DUF882 family)